MPFDLTQVSDEWVRKAYSYLDESRNSQVRRDWIEKRKTGWEFFENEQWTAEEKEILAEAGMPDFIINRLTGIIRTKSAIITDSKPQINHVPVGGGDDGVCQVLTRADSQVWDSENVNDRLYDAAIEMGVGGMAYFGVGWDKTAGVFGRAYVRHQDPMSVHIDPLVKKAQIYQGRFILVAQQISVAEARAKYGLKDDELGSIEKAQGDDEDEDNANGRDARMDDYGTVLSQGESGQEKTRDKQVWEIEAWLYDYENGQVVVDVASGQVSPASEPIKNVDKVNARAELLGSPIKVIERMTRVVKRILVVGTKLIEGPETNPYGMDSLFQPLVGVVLWPGTVIRGAYAIGDAWYMIGPQKELNKRRSQLIHTVSTQSSSNLVIPRNSMTEEEKAKAKKLNQVLEADPGASFTPYRLSPGSVGMQDVYLMMQEGKQDLEAIASMPEAMQGKGNAKDSGKKVLALQEAAMLQVKPTVRSLESVVTRVGRVLSQVLIMFAPGPFWQRLIDPRQEEQLVPAVMQIMNRDVSVAQYDVQVGAGSSLPANRMAKMEVLSEMAKAMGPNYQDIFAEAVAHYFDEPYLFEQIKQRNQQMEQMKAMAQATAAAQAMAQAGPGGPGGPPRGGPPPGIAPSQGGAPPMQ